MMEEENTKQIDKFTTKKISLKITCTVDGANSQNSGNSAYLLTDKEIKTIQGILMQNKIEITKTTNNSGKIEYFFQNDKFDTIAIRFDQNTNNYTWVNQKFPNIGSFVYAIYTTSSRNSDQIICNYIGKSKNLSSRFIQHFVTKSEKTYSKLDNVTDAFGKGKNVYFSYIKIEPDIAYSLIEEILIEFNLKNTIDRYSKSKKDPKYTVEHYHNLLNQKEEVTNESDLEFINYIKENTRNQRGS